MFLPGPFLLQEPLDLSSFRGRLCSGHLTARCLGFKGERERERWGRKDTEREERCVWGTVEKGQTLEH